MKNKILTVLIIMFALVAGYLIYRWARFSQLPDGSPTGRPTESLEISN